LFPGKNHADGCHIVDFFSVYVIVPVDPIFSDASSWSIRCASANTEFAGVRCTIIVKSSFWADSIWDIVAGSHRSIIRQLLRDLRHGRPGVPTILS
jgi:hypothetical protein